MHPPSLTVVDFNLFTPYGQKAVDQLLQFLAQGVIHDQITLQTVIEHVRKDDPISDGETADGYSQYEQSPSMTAALLAKAAEQVDILRDKVTVKTFLNRIIGMEVEFQNILFVLFNLMVDANIAVAKKEGRYSDGVTDVAGEHIAIKKGPIKLNSNMEHYAIQVDRGVSFEKAKAQFDADEKTKFYVSSSKQFGRHHYVLVQPKPSSDYLYFMTRPNTGKSKIEVDEDDLDNKYDIESDLEKVNAGWTKTYEQTAEVCIHGKSCKTPESCSIGKRIKEIHLVCGRIVAYWTKIHDQLQKLKLDDAAKAKKAMKIIRVVTTDDDSKRLVGLLVPEELTHHVAAFDVLKPPKKPAAVAAAWTTAQANAKEQLYIAHFRQAYVNAGYTPQQALGQARVQAMKAMMTFNAQLASTKAAADREMQDYIQQKQRYDQHAKLFAKPLDVEDATPIDSKAKKTAQRKKPTLLTFFGKQAKSATATAPAASSAMEAPKAPPSALAKLVPKMAKKKVIASPTKKAMSKLFANTNKRKGKATSSKSQAKRPKPIELDNSDDDMVPTTMPEEVAHAAGETEAQQCPICSKVLPRDAQLATMHVNDCLLK